MTYKRPASYTVFAIFNLIFGISGALCSFGGLVDANIEINQQDMSKQFADHVKEKAAGYNFYRYGSVVAGLVLGSLLAVSGIGLLQTANWGRMLAILVCIVSALLTIAQIAYTLAVMVPVIGEFFDLHAPKGGPIDMKSIFLMSMYGAAAFSALFVIFYVVEIIVLALAGPPKPAAEVPEYDDRRDERYGDDYDRPQEL